MIKAEEQTPEDLLYGAARRENLRFDMAAAARRLAERHNANKAPEPLPVPRPMNTTASVRLRELAEAKLAELDQAKKLREASRDQIRQGKRKLTIEDVQQVVTEQLGVSLERLFSNDRLKDCLEARFVGIGLCAAELKKHPKDIAPAFNRDRSTVIYTLQKIRDGKMPPAFRVAYARVEGALRQIQKPPK